MPTRILLIEDNPSDVLLVQKILQSAGPEYSLRTITRIDDSVPILDAGEADLALLDLNLPGSSGLESFHRLRAQAPELPIVILTGQKNSTLALEAVRGGAQDCLVKGELEGNLLLHAVRHARVRHALHQELAELALRDPLTGLYNRRGFRLLARQSLLLARRGNCESVLLLADVDGLKAINDTQGHLAGDHALCAVARALQASMRESDIVARLGGDEFVALAINFCAPDSASLVERIRERVEGESDGGRAILGLSISVGVASFDPRSSQTLDELIVAADSVMYREKRVDSEDERQGCQEELSP